MSSKLESDVCCHLQVVPSGESYEGKRRPGRKQRQTVVCRCFLPGLRIWRDSLHVTCRLTSCTPGSAPGPTLGNEYGKTLPLPWLWQTDTGIKTHTTHRPSYICSNRWHLMLCIAMQPNNTNHSATADQSILHTHSHPFNGPFSGTTWVSRYQECKTNLDFTEARDGE